jgi:hypothetical protein
MSDAPRPLAELEAALDSVVGTAFDLGRGVGPDAVSDQDYFRAIEKLGAEQEAAKALLREAAGPRPESEPPALTWLTVNTATYHGFEAWAGDREEFYLLVWEYRDQPGKWYGHLRGRNEIVDICSPDWTAASCEVLQSDLARRLDWLRRALGPEDT